jgi:formylglycine-generating enzyme required for sulfatase activity
MTDLDARIARLKRKLDATDDLDDRADLAAAIAALEQQRAPAEAPPSRTHTQHIAGYTTIAAAIAGDVHGDIYIVGERAESTKTLLAGYLRWLASQCGQLPLRGVREQKAATDVLNIGLDQVYTQLATEGLMEREVFEGAGLKTFDAKAYLAERIDERLLPWQQRIEARVFRPVGDVRTVFRSLIDQDAHSIGLGGGGSALEVRLNQQTSAEQLFKYAQEADRLTFVGPQLVAEAIAASPHLVLLGEPGSGKSTALRYLALTLAHAGLDATLDLAAWLEGWQTLGEQGRLIPLFMPLLPLAQRLAALPGRNGAAADLWAAIDAHLANHGATSDIITAMRMELARGHVLLLLDGLDEVAGSDSRRQVIDAVQGFAAEQPHCRMVVACRMRAYESEQNADWQLPGWPTATLADWTPGQVRAFIAAWYTAAAAASRMLDARRDERIAVLQRAVAERDDLRRLSIRPLLLTIMALVHLNDGRLPEDRVTLYSRCLDILLGQWEIAGKDATVYGTLMQYIGLPNADVKSLRPLLARVAYAAHQAAGQGEVGRLRRADLRELVADALEQLKHPDPHGGAKRFLEYTDVRAGLLQATEAGDAYAFPHQTFQEYLAGLELISGVGFVDRIMAVCTEDRWHIPIMLGIGHAVSEGLFSAPYQLLNRLLHASKRDAAQSQRDLIFAAEIAEDVGWDRLERGGDEFGALRRQLAEALARVVEGTALPSAKRVSAGLLLGRLGDPRAGVCTLRPEMAPIAGGSFVIGNTEQEYRGIIAAEKDGPFAQEVKDWYESTINDQSLTIAPFDIARYPVTNAQFARFIADRGYDQNQHWWDAAGQAWLRKSGATEPREWASERFGITRPNHPVVGVSWYEATAFCRWLTQTLNDSYDYVLPSEAEWEHAARGTARRIYPWGGDAPDGERANFDRANNSTTAVGCFSTGATQEGVLDLAGNVWEWTRSAYQSYPYDPEDGRETPDESVEKSFTLRGGGWDLQSVNLRASRRIINSPDNRHVVVGFRLARHLKV